MKLLSNLIIYLLLLLIWYGVILSGWINPLLLPSPSAVFHSLQTLLLTKEFWLDIAYTLGRTQAGFLLACLGGIPLGILVGSFAKISGSLEFLIDFARSIPATALIPLFTLFFGIGDLSKVVLISFVCTLIIAINTMYGIKHGKELRRITGQLLGLSKWQLFTKIILPEALPYIFVGLRIAISSAFIVVIVSEMFIGTSFGLGHRIVDAQSVYDTPTMYVAVILAGMLGYVINKVFTWLENDYTGWARR